MIGTTPLPVPQQEAMKQAFSQLNVPHIVFNGFAVGHTASEMTSIVSFAERPLAVLIMPPVIAKSFALSLLDLVKGYEAATGTTIETIDVLTERIASFAAEHEQ